MALGTPGSRLKKWRSTARNAYILKLQEFPILNEEDMIHAVRQLRMRQMIKVKLVVATDKSYGVHPVEGIMQIYFDQMNVIAKHLEELAQERQQAAMSTQPTVRNLNGSVIDEPNDSSPPKEPPPPQPPPSPNIEHVDEVAQSFTKKQLLKRHDWHDWEQGQFKQLDMYWNQGMFSNP